MQSNLLDSLHTPCLSSVIDYLLYDLCSKDNAWHLQSFGVVKGETGYQREVQRRSVYGQSFRSRKICCNTISSLVIPRLISLFVLLLSTPSKLLLLDLLQPGFRLLAQGTTRLHDCLSCLQHYSLQIGSLHPRFLSKNTQSLLKSAIDNPL
jgi:hypothetical protein